MRLVDSHAHIYLEEFDEDRPAVVQRAFEAGIDKIFLPNIDHTSIDRMLESEEQFDGCVAMMGLHPCSVDANFEKELYLVEDWLNKRLFCAVGEIGTDLYWDKSFWKEQQEAFKVQVGLARGKDLPVVIHCRDSIDETIQLLKEMGHFNYTGVFHCFTGTVQQAKEILDLGFYLGIGGVATFKNGGLNPVLEKIDLKNMLLETDSPYLAPAPNRGKRNEPAYISLVAQRIAEIKNVTLEEVARSTSNNAIELFGE